MKLDDFEYLHSTLSSLSDSCSSVSARVVELRALEKEKYKLFAEAKKISRSLTLDLRAVKRDIKEPKKPTVAPKPIRKKTAPKAKPKKLTKRKKASKKIETSKRVAVTSEDLEELRRLKSNLDAIRTSLK